VAVTAVGTQGPPEHGSWLVAYDVSDDRSRRRVARQLEGAGTRELFSVFRVPTSHGRVLRLVDEITTWLAPTDHLLAVPTCPRCVSRGVGAPLEPQPRSWMFAGSPW
jgi:CRISPR-associated endonuclease Cas2